MTRALSMLLAAGALLGCRERTPAPAAPPPMAVAADAAVDTPMDRAAPPWRTIATSRLPGMLWFVEEGADKTVVCAWQSLWVAQGSKLAAWYPSAQRVGAHVVGIRSTGDGSANGEQLELVACERGKITTSPIGPSAAQVRDPAADPQGRWIVVAANVDGHSDLYRIDLPVGTHVRLTNDVQGNFHPAALGSRDIVFVSSRDGDSELYRMPVKGGAATRLTAFHKDDWHPVPSPDGKQLAFLSDREGRPRIFLMTATGTELRRLTRRDDDLDELDPVWSPDGTQLAYVVERGSTRRLIVHDLATSIERELTPHGASDAEPQWSPDGAWLVSVRTRNDRVDLYATPAHGDGDAIRITDTAAVERLPRWHPRS